MSPVALFCALCVGHFVGDYPLQGDFLARAKNHKAGIVGVPWYQALTAHAAIQAGITWLITGSSAIALLEFVCHWCIDRTKCEFTCFETGYNLDQLAHLVCKVLWVLFLARAWA